MSGVDMMPVRDWRASQVFYQRGNRMQSEIGGFQHSTMEGKAMTWDFAEENCLSAYRHVMGDNVGGTIGEK